MFDRPLRKEIFLNVCFFLYLTLEIFPMLKKKTLHDNLKPDLHWTWWGSLFMCHKKMCLNYIDCSGCSFPNERFGCRVGGEGVKDGWCVRFMFGVFVLWTVFSHSCVIWCLNAWKGTWEKHHRKLKKFKKFKTNQDQAESRTVVWRTFQMKVASVISVSAAGPRQLTTGLGCILGVWSPTLSWVVIILNQVNSRTVAYLLVQFCLSFHLHFF